MSSEEQRDWQNRDYVRWLNEQLAEKKAALTDIAQILEVCGVK
jgi:hypothetical protein